MKAIRYTANRYMIISDDCAVGEISLRGTCYTGNYMDRVMAAGAAAMAAEAKVVEAEIYAAADARRNAGKA